MQRVHLEDYRPDYAKKRQDSNSNYAYADSPGPTQSDLLPMMSWVSCLSCVLASLRPISSIHVTVPVEQF
ncbi:MAG: hypothetical protein ACFFDI_23295 [Promethearchaeota archaeon]